MATQKIPATPSIRRLPSYLTLIRQARDEGHQYISGTAIAHELNLEPIQVRKDLAITAITGKPKRGYPVNELIASIEHFLGWDREHKTVIIGAGNLATALMGYNALKNRRLNFVAAFDVNPKKTGSSIHDVHVYPMAEFEDRVREFGAEIAVLAVPSAFAQDCADRIARTDIKGVWNFTNRKIRLPEHIVCEKEDLSSGYAMLCVMMEENSQGE